MVKNLQKISSRAKLCLFSIIAEREQLPRICLFRFVPIFVRFITEYDHPRMRVRYMTRVELLLVDVVDDVPLDDLKHNYCYSTDSHIFWSSFKWMLKKECDNGAHNRARGE